MSAPKPKSNEWIQLLTPSLLEGKNLLSEFEAKRVIAGSRKLPDRYQGLGIEGLVKIVCGEIEEGVELCERSIFLAPHDQVTWANYALAFANKGIHSKQLEILRRAVDAVREPELLSDVIIVAAFWIDMDLLNKVVPMYLAMEIQPSETCAAAISTFDKLLSLGEQVKDLEEVAKAVRKVAERHSLPPVSTQVGDDGYGMLAFSFVVDTDDVALLSTLNDQLVEEMISSGLETSNCIGFFEPKGE